MQISNNDSNFFLSEGNLALTASNNDGYRNCSATFSPMGFKGYIEFVASALNHKIGIIADTTHPTNQDYANSGPQHVTLEYNGEVKFPNNGTSFRSASDHNLGTFSTGDVMGMAFDFTGTNRNVWFHRANTYGTASGGLGNPATCANPIVTATQLDSTGPYRFHFGINNGPVLRINFGQDGTFGGTETAQGNKDDNGIGDFYYDVPSGFLALSSANFSDDDLPISPAQDTQANEYFSPALFTGTSGDVDVAVPFKPDWVWIKARVSQGHSLVDSVRGGTKLLQSNSAGTENSVNSGNDVNEIHFTDDGFTSNTDWHTNNYNYVSWNWKAGGAPTVDNDAGANAVPKAGSAKIDGSNATASFAGTIPITRLSANTTAGFSIVTYTGNGSTSSGVTINHGLGKTPAWIITKKRNSVGTDYGWSTWHKDLGGNYGVWLEKTNARNFNMWAGYSNFNNTVFAPADKDYNNVNNATYVSYVFAEVEGYSKFDSYTGNNSANGPFVYLGFRPAWIMTKNYSSAGGSWGIYDNTRNPSNTGGTLMLRANASDADYYHATYTPIDFLSNGFKIRNTGGEDNSAQSFIYMAFAEAPFKYANAR